MIEIRAASKSFGARHLWADVNLSIPNGGVIALVGPSGSGKSTLLNCIGLLEDLDAGHILVDSREVTQYSARQVRSFRREELGYLFQNYALIESATIRQNLAVVIGVRERFRREAVDMRFSQALERVGLEGRANTPVHTLSGGEQQRVALARLLVKKPSVILADEPTGALDDANATVVMEVLRSFAQDGATVVVATHSNLVMNACDSAIDVSVFSPDASPTRPMFEGHGAEMTSQA